MLHVVLWKWRQYAFRESYTYKHVNQVATMLRNFTSIPMRVICITDDSYGIDSPTQTYALWKDHENLPNVTGRHLPSCYRRLRLFDRETQESLGIAVGDRVCSLDLDSIIVQSLDDFWKWLDEQDCAFAGWGVPGTYHKFVFNGSFWYFKAGDHLQHMWSSFNPQVSPRETMAKGFLGSDQAWLSFNFVKRKDVVAINYPVFASYSREVRRQGRIDAKTKIVFFHGARKPWHAQERRQQAWITRYWPGGPNEPR